MFDIKRGVQGEFKYSVYSSDGVLLKETDYQKNLVLDQGLDYLGRTTGSWQESCSVGTGNSVPTVAQTSLDSEVKNVALNTTTEDYSYTDDGSGYYKVSKVTRYDFIGLGEVNISEIGLKGTNILCTRSLIKDEFGVPTTISILSGEILVVHYRVTSYFSTEVVTKIVNVVDRDGGEEPYKVSMQISGVGQADLYRSTVGSGFSLSTRNDHIYGGITVTKAREFLPITARATSANKDVIFSVAWRNYATIPKYVKIGGYTKGQFKKNFTVTSGIQDMNGDIGYIIIEIPNGFGFQAKIERVSDGAPLTKTDKHTLSIPFYVSWSRFEE